MKDLITLFLVALFSNGVSQNNTLNFNGANNDISFGYNPTLDFSSNSVFTIESWFNTSTLNNVIYSNRIDFAPFVGHELGVFGGKIFFEICSNYLTSAMRIETSNTFNDGNWHHVACVYSGNPSASTVKMYVDGTLQNHVATNDNLNASANTGNPITIGSRASMAYYFSGNIDEVRVWGRALCADEIIANKNCHLTGQEHALLSYFNFNQGSPAGNNTSVTSLNDISGNNNTGSLNGFNLVGSTSNWIAATNGVTGTCSAFSVPLTITTSNAIFCKGLPVTLVGNGAQTYTWQPGNKTGAVQTFTPSSTTTYTLFANTASGCTGSTLFTQEVSSCTSISITEKKDVLIYPNPFSGEFYLENIHDEANLVVLDLSGRTVYMTQVSPLLNKISIPNLENGIYLLQLSSSGSVITTLISKQGI